MVYGEKKRIIRPKYRDNGQSATKPTLVGRLTDFKGRHGFCLIRVERKSGIYESK